MKSARIWLGLLLLLPIAAGAQNYGSDDDSASRRAGADAPLTFPAYPKAENYLPFEVNPVTPFKFFVDSKSIGVADGVVRYSLIAKSPDGALNVSFEAMRCIDREYRIYAFGRPDNTWFKVRDPRWKPIPVDPRNSERDVLYSSFFCPVTANIKSAEDGVNALKNGGNPGATMSGY